MAILEDEVPPFESLDRALATLRVIDAIGPVPGSPEHDFISLGGWRCVAPRTKHSVGDIVVFIEIDSFISHGQALFPAFDNLSPRMQFEGVEGFLVETICLGRGGKQVSQGLIYTVEDLPPVRIAVAVARLLNIDRSENELRAILLGWDLTVFLGIKKYDMPQLASEPEDRLGKFPAFLHRPKMDRVQNCRNFFIKSKYKRYHYQESVKLDGASMTCYFVRKDSKHYQALPALPEADGFFQQAIGKTTPQSLYDTKVGRFGICSANRDINSVVRGFSGVDYWEAALQDKLPQSMQRLNANLAIQGELIGWNISGNRHNYPANKTQFYVFAIWDIDRQAYWPPRKAHLKALELGLRHVPVRRDGVKVLDICSQQKAGNVEFLELANGLDGEGLVYKCIEDGRWFKVISNSYLLKHGIDRPE